MERVSKVLLRTSVVFLSLSIVFISCSVPVSSFQTPNDVADMRATVYMNDNSSVLAYMSLNTKETDDIQLRIPPNRRTETIHVDSIKGYELETGYYARKYLNQGDQLFGFVHAQPRGYSFVKQLTPQDYEMNVFEHIIKVKEQKSPLMTTQKKYYIEVPGAKDTIWSLQSNYIKKQLQPVELALKEQAQSDEALRTSLQKLQRIPDRVNYMMQLAKLYQVYIVHKQRPA
ncbi:MAG: hypothetical protein J0I41_05855 [Filimonas sp.]|nr:hypothetical protein [Filimonas sp.]